MFGLTTEIKEKEAERLLFLGENMADWKNININKNLIKHDTGKSTLIAMPHKSDYDGWEFWFPSKLVRESFKRKDAVNIGYTDEFIFHLKKYGHGRYNSKEIISDQDIDVKEFERAFCVVAGNIDASITEEPEVPLIHIPDWIEPEATTADEELVDE